MLVSASILVFRIFIFVYKHSLFCVSDIKDFRILLAKIFYYIVPLLYMKWLMFLSYFSYNNPVSCKRNIFIFTINFIRLCRMTFITKDWEIMTIAMINICFFLITKSFFKVILELVKV